MRLPAEMGRPVYRLYQGLWGCLDWLFPPLCAGCGRASKRWCEDCQAGVKLLSFPICEKCGGVVSQQGMCQQCQTQPPVYEAVRSWAEYKDPLRSAIHRLKYKGNVSLGETFARPLMELHRSLHWRVDCVVPVPSGIASKKQRGYNQAALLALPLALEASLTYQPKALIKVKETRSQVGLTLAQRRENVFGAYRARPELVAGKCVLIVDDVFTSGSTMEACATALKQAGALKVYGLTLARAGIDSK